MARIAGVDLPPQKRLWVGLTSIYGIGQERAKKLAEKAGVDHQKKIRDLTEDEINHLRQEIEKEGRVEGDLLTEIAFHAAFFFDFLPKMVDFIFGQVANLFLVIDARLFRELLRALLPDAIDRG